MSHLTRRFFLKRFIQSLSAVSLARLPVLGDSGPAYAPLELVILTTNDTHSRLDPFPMDGGRNAGLGGIARRATLIRQLRARHPHVLLLDAGDIFQGTPYFNFFQGEPEIRAMSALGYDCATIGNHEFDAGVQGLADAVRFANFPFVSANLTAESTPLAKAWKPWRIKEVGRYRIGLFGLTIRLQGLVSASWFAGVEWHDPIERARAAVAELEAEGCDAIICLSHLGFGDREFQDRHLARAVPGIDLIVGGHTHTFINQQEWGYVGTEPRTLITQQGFAGIRLGVIRVQLGGGERMRVSHVGALPVSSISGRVV